MYGCSWAAAMHCSWAAVNGCSRAAGQQMAVAGLSRNRYGWLAGLGRRIYIGSAFEASRNGLHVPWYMMETADIGFIDQPGHLIAITLVQLSHFDYYIHTLQQLILTLIKIEIRCWL